MKRIALLFPFLIFLAGCSELRVFGSAAVYELRADAIAVEAAEETKHDFSRKKRDEGAILMAMNMARYEKSRNQAKGRLGKKGLWEGQ
jgi:hypothetical protein